jgi:hypothetical protein
MNDQASTTSTASSLFATITVAVETSSNSAGSPTSAKAYTIFEFGTITVATVAKTEITTTAVVKTTIVIASYFYYSEAESFD